MKPAYRRVIARVTTGNHPHACGAAGLRGTDKLQRPCGGQYILEIAQIKQGHNLGGAQVEEQAPQRHTTSFGPQIEAGIGDGR